MHLRLLILAILTTLTLSFLNSCSRKWSKEKPVIDGARSYAIQLLDNTKAHTDVEISLEKQQLEDLNSVCLEKPCVFLSAENYCKIAALIQSCKMWDHTYFNKANDQCFSNNDGVSKEATSSEDP
jgi:hypothetical protein